MMRWLLLLLVLPVLAVVSEVYAQGNEESATTDRIKPYYVKNCSGCHGLTAGTPIAGLKRALQGQTQAELLMKLEGYKAGTYGGSRKATMENKVRGLESEQLHQLSGYIAEL